MAQYLHDIVNELNDSEFGCIFLKDDNEMIDDIKSSDDGIIISTDVHVHLNGEDADFTIFSIYNGAETEKAIKEHYPKEARETKTKAEIGYDKIIEKYGRNYPQLEYCRSVCKGELFERWYPDNKTDNYKQDCKRFDEYLNSINYQAINYVIIKDFPKELDFNKKFW